MTACLIAIAGCTEPVDDPPTAASSVPRVRDAERPTDVSVPTARAARDGGVAFATKALDDEDSEQPFLLIAFYFLHERFGIPDFADLRERALAAADREDPLTLSQLRILDPAARPDLDQLAGLPPVARLMAESLACDMTGAPPPDTELMKQLIGSGGFDATHVGVALSIRAQLGCAFDDTSTRDQLVDSLQAAIDQDQRVDELVLEQLTMLADHGGRERLTAPLISEVLRAQHPDGSWGTDDRDQLHSTALAIAVLSTWLGDETGTALLGEPDGEGPAVSR